VQGAVALSAVCTTAGKPTNEHHASQKSKPSEETGMMERRGNHRPFPFFFVSFFFPSFPFLCLFTFSCVFYSLSLSYVM
jgi:hypothetical protein